MSEEDLDHAHKILQAHASISVRDALHAATALRRGIKSILRLRLAWHWGPGPVRPHPAGESPGRVDVVCRPPRPWASRQGEVNQATEYTVWTVLD